MFPHSIGRLFIVAAFWTSVSIGLDYDILTAELQQLSDIPLNCTLKMFRGELRDRKFNFSGYVTSDDLSIYDVEGTLYRSAIGNNKYVLSPFKVPRKPFCDFVNGEYREKIMDDLALYSNFPCEHDLKVDYCDLLKKGIHYELINYAFNVSILPKYAPTGTFKFIGSGINRITNELVLNLTVIAKVY